MGRDSWSYRWTVEECKRIGISDLARAGVFEQGPGHFWTYSWTNLVGEQVARIGYWLRSHPSGKTYIRFSYTLSDRFSDEKTDMDYSIDLVTTPCHFGGLRYWFICPLVVDGRPCEKRVGKVYLPPGAKYFGCRHCHNLTYRCQKEHDKRLDGLLKNPEMLEEQLKKGDPGAASLAMRLFFEIARRQG